MSAKTTSIKISGNVTEAVAALEHLGIKIQEEAEHGESRFKAMSGKVAGTFSKLGSTIGGEVGEMLTKVSEGLEQVGEHVQGLAPKIQAAGSALAGIGVGLQMMGSKDKAANEQLKQSIENTGASYEDFAKEIEETIKHNENFGESAVQTQQALQILTQATNSPKTALEDMAAVSDLAAAKHESLATAATAVAKVYSGNAKSLKEFGIPLENQTKMLAAATSAEKTHAAAVTALHAAQKRLSDLETVDAGKKQLSISEELALRNAKEAVTTATEKATETQKVATEAQDKAKDSAGAAQEAIDQLAKKVKGQASASVNSFAGRLDVLRTKLEDQAAVFGQKYGPAITSGGVALMAFGTILPGIVKGTSAVFSGVGKLASGLGGLAVKSAGVAKSMAQTAALHAMYVKDMIVNGARWVAAHAVQTVTAIAQYVAQAAAATAAFIAENAATLGIIAAIALLVTAIVFLATHWRQVWADIKKWALDAWNSAIKPVFNFIKHLAIDPIILAVKLYARAWKDAFELVKAATQMAWNDVIKPVFNVIQTVAINPIKEAIHLYAMAWQTAFELVKTVTQGAWNFLQGMFNFINQDGIQPIRQGIQDFGQIWDAIWQDVKTAVQDAWDFIKPIVDTIKSAVGGVAGAVSTVSKAAGGAIGAVKHLFADGGPVNAPQGAPVPAIVHGGEYVLSTAMLAGSQPIDPRVVAAVAKSMNNGPAAQFAPSAQGGGSAVQLTVNTMNGPTATELARELAWQIRGYGS